MWEVGSVRSTSPRGSGRRGIVSTWACAADAAERSRAIKSRQSIIRSSPPDPVSDQTQLCLIEIGPALGHAVARDAGAGQLAVEIGVGEVTRRHPLQ